VSHNPPLARAIESSPPKIVVRNGGVALSSTVIFDEV